MRRALTLALLLLAVALPGAAQKPPAPGTPPGPPAGGRYSVEIVRFGIYDLKVEELQRGQDGLGHGTVRDMRLLEQTARVPGRVGVHFGVEYHVRGGKPGQAVTLDGVTIFPPAGLTPPGQATVRESIQPLQLLVGGDTPGYRGWSFDDPWEVVPGRWRIEFRMGGQVIGGQDFDVVAPQASGKFR